MLIAFLIGFEASSSGAGLWRGAAGHTLGFVVGEDTEIAEQRFFSEWTETHGATITTAGAEPGYTAPVRRGAPSPSDVIGLFPEPGGARR